MNQQQQIDRIIAQEIHMNVSQLVQHFISQGLDYDNSAAFVELHSECLEHEDLSEAPDGYEVFERQDGVWGWLEDLESFEYGSREEAVRAAYEDADEDIPMVEALEFYAVSDWLAGHLEDMGEPVARDVHGLDIWGRTTSGQMIGMDDCISDLALALATES